MTSRNIKAVERDQACRQTRSTDSVDDIIVCYKITSEDADHDAIIHDGKMADSPSLTRMRVSKTTFPLMRHAVQLAKLIEEHKHAVEEAGDDFSKLYSDSKTTFCPDLSELLDALSQYGIVLKKLDMEKGGKRVRYGGRYTAQIWQEVTYGGTEFARMIDRGLLGKAAVAYIGDIERDANQMANVSKIQITRFSGSDVIFLIWQNAQNEKYICYAHRDLSPISPSAVA